MIIHRLLLNARGRFRYCHNMTTECENFEDFVKKSKKIIGAALAYRPMEKEPTSPVLFLKPSTSYIVEGQPIIIPKVFDKVVHEVELGVIIGKKCKNVDEKNAMDYVAGYCLALDMTAMCNLAKSRAEGFPWTISKGFDTSTPVSSFIPKDKIDPFNVDLWLKVNGKELQRCNTKDLIFNVPQLISYITQTMTLEPYDLILTGTPSGSSRVVSGDWIECGLNDLVQLKFELKGDQDK